MEINAGPEIPKSEFFKPGADSGDLEEQLRVKVAKSANLSVPDVTPSSVVAENDLNNFFEKVVHTISDNKNATEDEGSSRMDEIKEEFEAVMPGERSNPVRIADNEVGAKLKAQREIDIGYQEEAA